MTFEAWLRTVCFQAPAPEAHDLAKCAWEASQSLSQEAVREEEHDLLMVAAAYRDIWLICHENTPREAKLGENLELGHLRGRLFAAIDLALKREPNAAANFQTMALKMIAEWDCLNPPRPDLLGDLPWLKRLVDRALAGNDPRVETAPQAGQDRLTAPSQEGHAAGPASAAPDVASVVKRLERGEIQVATMYEGEWVRDMDAAREIATLIAKLGQTHESGWLIERIINEHHEWLAGWNDDGHGFVSCSARWTRDAFGAIRFSRKLDGERLKNSSPDFVGTKVTDHLFLPPVPGASDD